MQLVSLASPREPCDLGPFANASYIDIKNGSGPAESLFINENVDTPILKDGDILIRVKVGKTFMVLSNISLTKQRPSG